jgi:hypothetical protein
MCGIYYAGAFCCQIFTNGDDLCAFDKDIAALKITHPVIHAEQGCALNQRGGWGYALIVNHISQVIAHLLVLYLFMGEKLRHPITAKKMLNVFSLFIIYEE